jgi:hypothetical protein
VHIIGDSRAAESDGDVLQELLEQMDVKMFWEGIRE